MKSIFLFAASFLVAGTLTISPAIAERDVAIQQLTEVGGRAEVIDHRYMNIYGDHGIVKVGLLWPAETHSRLRNQLVSAIRVQCLLFGSTTAATCVAVDQFGARWMLGRKKQLAFTK